MKPSIRFLLLINLFSGLGVSADSITLDQGFGFELLMAKMESLEKRVSSLECQLENKTNAVITGQSEVIKVLQSQQNGPKVYESCDKVPSKKSGVYRIRINLRDSIEVFCDQKYDNGGWVVIQNRFDGSVNFYRDWNEYKKGFGFFDGEFWLGLDTIHQLTYSRPTELVVLLEDFEGNSTFAKLDRFEIAGEGDDYKATIASGYSGTAGDSISGIAPNKFSTFDRDHDTHAEGSCATMYHGAWWYSACHGSNLNGKYLKGETSEYATGMVWNAFRGYHYSLKFARMMIRRKNI